MPANKSLEQKLAVWLEEHNYPPYSYRYDPQNNRITWTRYGESVSARIWESRIAGIEFDLRHEDDLSRPFAPEDLKKRFL